VQDRRRSSIQRGGEVPAMKSHTEYLVFETKKRKEMVHITDQRVIVKVLGVE
jgi:hypothetical protein